MGTPYSSLIAKSPQDPFENTMLTTLMCGRACAPTSDEVCSHTFRLAATVRNFCLTTLFTNQFGISGLLETWIAWGEL